MFIFIFRYLLFISLKSNHENSNMPAEELKHPKCRKPTLTNYMLNTKNNLRTRKVEIMTSNVHCIMYRFFYRKLLRPE